MSTDTVEKNSGFLSTYMSGHTDTLVAYVLYYGKVRESLSTAKMTSIDQNRMNLSYQTPESSKWNEISVEFDPPLSGYEEVKPRLMQMKADAEEGLGMAKAPRLTTFELKLSTFRALPFLVILLVLSLAPYQEYTFTKEKFPPVIQPAIPALNLTSQTLTHVRQALPFTPNTAIVLWSTIGIIHASFALLVGFFSYHRQTGFKLGAAWVLSALFLSFPAVLDFRSHIQASRINSIRKNN